MKTIVKILIGIAGLFSLCGCVHLSESRQARAPAKPLDEEILSRFDKPVALSTSATERDVATNARYRVVRVELRSAPQLADAGEPDLPAEHAEVRAGSDEAGPIEWLNEPESAVTATTDEDEQDAEDGFAVSEATEVLDTPKIVPSPSHDSEGSTNVIEYYRVPGEHRPVILVLPMAGGRRYVVEGIFARYFAQHGFAAVITHRPKIAREFEPDAVDGWLADSVRDNQRVMDWIETRPELDSKRIGVFGISLGGIRGALLTALDPRVKAAVLGLAGGDLPYIFTHSEERGVVQRLEAYLRAHHTTREKLQTELRDAITLEPNALAGQVDPHKVMLVLARFDRIVPFKKGWELRARLGGPETIILPTGHYTAGLLIPYIEHQSLGFLRNRLEVGPVNPPTTPLYSPRAAGG